MKSQCESYVSASFGSSMTWMRKSNGYHSRHSGETAPPDNGGDPVKVIEMDEANIKECVKDAQHERVILTRRGKPIAVIAGVAGMDLEQIALGHSDEFWQLIRERRGQKS